MVVGMSGRIASPSKRTIFPTLRFRAKIILGFAVVLAISAGSMAFCYFGFERVSAGVGSYRSSVSEADLARNIAESSAPVGTPAGKLLSQIRNNFIAALDERPDDTPED